MPLRKNLGLRHDSWGGRLFASSFADEEQTEPLSTSPSERIQAEETRFEALVERFRRPLLGFIFRLVNDERLAEALAEETFLNVNRSRRGGSDGDFAIAIYRAGAALALSQNQEVPTGLASDERQAKIRRSVEELPEAERLAVLLHKYQELNSAEIAAVLSVGEKEAKSLLLRAYELLRIKLSGIVKRSTE